MTDREIILKLRAVHNELIAIHGDGIRCSSLLISFSNQFQTRAGDAKDLRFNNFEIRLSRKLLNEFGYDRIEKCFRHELAHVYCFKRGDYRHSQLFKRVCQSFGGSMNSRMAGWRYSDAASKEYIKSNRQYKYEYICSGCGLSTKRKKRMSSRILNNPNRVCIKCKTPITQWTEERIG